MTIDIADEWIEFAIRTFPSTPDRNVNKVVEEALELRSAPTDPSEIADVVLSVLYHAHLCGVDIPAAVREKARVNMRRTWEENGDGTYSHVKD